MKKSPEARVLALITPEMVAAEIDRELVGACQRGDREAFRALFEAYRHKVYSIALRYTGEPAAAMDVAQDVFVRLFLRIGEFRGESSFDSWLYRLIVNCCLDQRRKLRRLAPLFDIAGAREIASGHNVAADVERGEMERQVQKAVSKLPPDLRMAVVLRYTEGLSYDEIAEAAGCSAGTVASRLHRAHKTLARRLSHLGQWLLGGE